MTAASAFNFPIASRGMHCLIEEGATATAIIPVFKACVHCPHDMLWD